jgi:hypothetical protein
VLGEEPADRLGVADVGVGEDVARPEALDHVAQAAG